MPRRRSRSTVDRAARSRVARTRRGRSSTHHEWFGTLAARDRAPLPSLAAPRAGSRTWGLGGAVPRRGEVRSVTGLTFTSLSACQLQQQHDAEDKSHRDQIQS